MKTYLHFTKPGLGRAAAATGAVDLRGVIAVRG